MMKTYFVKTQDVDHNGPARKYAKRENAVARFERMVGYTMAQVLVDQMPDGNEPPDPGTIKRLRGVSMFGTVVTFWEVEKTDEELGWEKSNREYKAAARKAKAERKAIMKAEREARKASKAAAEALDNFNYPGSRHHY